MIASAPVTVAAAVVVAGFSQFCLLSMITGIREEKCQDWQEIIVSLTMLIGNNHFIDPQLRTKMSAKTTTDGNSRDGFSTEYNFFKKHQQKSYSPNVGLEPTTLRLRVSCSTDWASRAVEKTERIIRKLKWELRRNLFGWNPICSRFGSRVSFSSNEKERVLAST